MKISPALSAYLDFLRFLAALAVLFGHMTQDGFATGWIPIGKFSHPAVVIFFVMSGFIVYSSTVMGASDGRRYFVARASRIYSVALPAVIFSSALAVGLDLFAPELKRGISSYRDFSLADIAASLLFLNQSWAMATDVPLNAPYWSLCYEVWYYAFFGIFFFVRSPWRWLWLALAFTVAGPAIFVLFPIWFLGAWLASQHNKLPVLSHCAAWLLYLGSIVIVIAVATSGFDRDIKVFLQQHVRGFWFLGASQRMGTDYLVGIAIAIHIYAYSSLHLDFQAFFVRFKHVLAQLAGFSFTLYLFHRPISLILVKQLGQLRDSVSVAIGSAILILFVCWLISFGTERRLQQWRAALAGILKLPARGRGPQQVVENGSR